MNQETLDSVFRILRTVHKSHWKAPKLEIVESEIKRTGKFVFRIGADPYVSEVIITNTSVDYLVNSNLTARLKEIATHYKEQFDTTFSSLKTL